MASKAEKRRRDLIKIHGHKYRRHFLAEGYFCFYCGDRAQGLDHVPPVSMIEDLPYEKRKKWGIPCVLLPSCNECNFALNNRGLFNVFDRLLFLESYFDAKLQKQTSLWSESEIKELGHNLQGYVRAKQEGLQWLASKIRAIQVRQIKPETFPKFIEEDSDSSKGKKTPQKPI